MRYKLYFLLISLSIPVHSFGMDANQPEIDMNFAEFNQELRTLYDENFNKDNKISSIKEHACVLLQLSKNSYQERSINHLSEALEAIFIQYPFLQSFKVGNGIWPHISCELDISDKEKRNKDFNKIIAIIRDYKGLPGPVYDFVDKFQKVSFPVRFPKEVPIYTPYDKLHSLGLLNNNHRFSLYPLESKTPEKHIIFKKDKRVNYLFTFIQKNDKPPFKIKFQIDYNYKCYYKNKNKIASTILRKGDFNDLSKTDQEKFEGWFAFASSIIEK